MNKHTKKLYQDRLFGGLNIYIDGIGISSPKLEEIFAIGEDMYNFYISLCLKDDYNELIGFLVKEDLLAHFVNGLRFITKQAFEFTYVDDKLVFYFENNSNTVLLNGINYLRFKEAVMLANHLEIRDKPKTVFEMRVEKAKQKVRETLSKKGKEEISLRDLVSSLVGVNQLLLSDFFVMTYYQFFYQFKRYQLIEKYQTDLNSIFAGADSNKVDLKYYIKNL